MVDGVIKECGWVFEVGGLRFENRDFIQGIGGVIEGIVIEGGRDGGVGGIVSTIGAIGAQQDVCQCVGLPLQAKVATPVIAAGEVRRMTVGEGARGLTVEVLNSGLCLVVAVTVVPTEAEVHLQLVVVVVVQISAEHLTGIQSATVPPACVLLFVVEIAKQDKASLVGETTGHPPRSIAVLRSSGKVEVGHVASVHAFLDAEIEHGLLLAVLDAGDACLVTLLVIEFQVLDNAYGNVHYNTF